MFGRKDNKYLIYLAKDLAEDSIFRFEAADSRFVKLSFKVGENKLFRKLLALA